MEDTFIQFDNNSGMWCVLGVHTGKFYGAFLEKEEAESY